MPAHILIVEDDPLCRFMLEEHFIEHGFTVSTLETGKDVEALILKSSNSQKGPVKLAIIDVMLPG